MVCAVRGRSFRVTQERSNKERGETTFEIYDDRPRKEEKTRRKLTENRLEGLLVPVHVHTSAVDGRRSPLLRTRSTGPIPRRSGRDEDSLRRDVPHSQSESRTQKSCARPRSFSLFLSFSLSLSLSLSLARSRYQSGRTRAGSTTDYAYRYTASTSISRQRSFQRVPLFRSRRREQQPRDVASRGPVSRRTVPRVARVAVIPCHGLKSEPRARET